MLFNPPPRRSKSRHSDSPIMETPPTYSFNALLPSVPVNQVGISAPGQRTMFALKRQSPMMEKLLHSFLHLFCKRKSRNLFGQGREVFVFLWHLKDSAEILSAFCLSCILLIFLPLPQSSCNNRNVGYPQDSQDSLPLIKVDFLK